MAASSEWVHTPISRIMAYVVFIKPEKARVLDRQLTYASSLSIYLSLITLASCCLSSLPWGQKCLCELTLWSVHVLSQTVSLPSPSYIHVRTCYCMLYPRVEHETNLKPFLIYYVMLALALDLRALILINIHTHTHTHTHSLVPTVDQAWSF